MIYNKVNLIYFSATNTTKKIVQYIADGIGIANTATYNITKISDGHNNVSFNANELVIVGCPVYAGRIPQIAVDVLNKFKGSNTPAVVVNVYGNRDFDDALLELHDIFKTNGFKVISAAAFVAQHSIFPKVGQNRPNDDDRELAVNFGRETMKRLAALPDVATLPDVKVKGNFPYKPAKSIPLKPKASRKCDSCGTCVRMCPTQAIDEKNPRRTNKDLCISCARCIFVCPQHARHFGGLLYSIVSRKFTKNFSTPKSPYIVYID